MGAGADAVRLERLAALGSQQGLSESICGMLGGMLDVRNTVLGSNPGYSKLTPNYTRNSQTC